MIASLPDMRDLPAANLKMAVAAISLAFVLVGCRGTKSVDFPVSSPPSDSAGAHRGFAQSETAMVRIDLTADRKEDEPLARYLVGYNDDTLAVADAGSSCFTFQPQRPTLDGWARSDQFGGDWLRQEQLPVSPALVRRGVGARHGDPWLAAWSSKDPDVPNIVLYVSVAQRGPGRLDGPFFLLLSRSRDNGKTFEDSFVLLGPQGAVPDGPKVAIVADLQVQAGTLPDEAHREKVILYRLPKADTCDARHHRGDLDSCGSTIAGREIDALAKANDMETVASRAGLWESKPAVFTGKVPDGTVDPRVGVIWYAQPYKGRISVTDEMRARTIVEAAVSKDGGVTFAGPFNLTAARREDSDTPKDPDIGAFFHPCQILCSGYFGEYLSGVFQFADTTPIDIVGTWGDSREGCTDQTSTTKHHHVWAGALRPTN